MLVLLLVLGCAHPVVQSGTASWYGRELRGHPTASGERFKPWRRTAAHRTLPLGTVVEVTRVDTGASVRVVINDRGPFVDGRIIDLARRPARKVDMLDIGLAPVELRIVGCRRSYGGCAD